MVGEKFTGHGRMTPPAEKANVGPEFYIVCPVHSGIRSHGVAYKTDRLTVQLNNAAIVLHDMGINLSIRLLLMTLEADISPVLIRSAPQKVRCFG